MFQQTVLGLHIFTAGISISFFLLRAYWSFTANPQLSLRWVRILPHVNDTVLLTAGITLAFVTQQYPIAQAWLTAKLVALIIYIFLGMMVLKGRISLKAKFIYLILGVMCFAYIVLAAINKSPMLFLF